MIVNRHKKFKALTSRHPVFAISVAFAFVFIGVGAESRFDADNRREETAKLLYDNSVSACDRGNVIRKVVFANTKAATSSQVDGGKYAAQLAYLKKQPFTNQEDGTIDCDAAIPKP